MKQGLLLDVGPARPKGYIRTDIRRKASRQRPYVTHLTEIVLPPMSISRQDRLSAGRFDFVHAGFNGENFPVSVIANRRELFSVRFFFPVTLQTVLGWLRQEDFLSAFWEEGLVVASHSVYGKVSTVVTGAEAMWQGRNHVLFCDIASRLKNLSLIPTYNKWDSGTSFLAAKNVVPRNNFFYSSP